MYVTYPSIGADGIDKANDVDQNARDVSGISSPGQAVPVEVRTGLLRRVQALHGKVTLADNVVVADEHAGDGGEEDGICRQVGGEVVGRAEQIPRAHADAHDGTDVAAAADVEVPGQESRQVGTGRNAVRGDVCAQLGENESRRDHEDAKALGTRSVVEQELREEVERVPDRRAVDDGGGG